MSRPAINPPEALVKICHGLAELATRYDNFLIDQWGVLHDGRAPYPGAVDCLQRLAAIGKRVVIVSNSGKRAAENAARLAELGFPESSYSELVTSGEVLWSLMANGQLFNGQPTGRQFLLLSSEDPSTFGDDLSFVKTAKVEDADFIVLAGLNDDRPDQYYDHLVKVGLEKSLPMICSNPDLTRITPDGLKAGSGAMARHYERMGGRVRYIGKPYPEIYSHCQPSLTEDSRRRTLAIGDSMHHDIAGGHAAGFDTLLIMGGIHAKDIPIGAPHDDLRAKISGLVAATEAQPDWAITTFAW